MTTENLKKEIGELHYQLGKSFLLHAIAYLVWVVVVAVLLYFLCDWLVKGKEWPIYLKLFHILACAVFGWAWRKKYVGYYLETNSEVIHKITLKKVALKIRENTSKPKQ